MLLRLWCALALLLLAANPIEAATLLSEERKIAAPGGGFVAAAALDGDTAALGTPNIETVYVFQRDEGGPGNWGQVATLTPSDGLQNDDFGEVVAISGDRIAVGSPRNDGDKGAVYLFERDAGGVDNWGEVAKLVSTDPFPFSGRMGSTVSIDGDVVLTGAPVTIISNAGVGTAYVFERDEGGPANWGQVLRLAAFDGVSGDAFGRGVTLDGDTAVVGAPLDDGAGGNSGSVYLYGRDVGGLDNWGLIAKREASDAEAADFFGDAVALDGDTLLVSAALDDDNGPDSGSIYVLERHAGGVDNWGEVTKIAPPNGVTALFGAPLDLDGGTAIAGAISDERAENAGAAYVFDRDQGGPDNWGQIKRLTASDAVEDTAVAAPAGGVATDGGHVLVTARNDAAYLFSDAAPLCAVGPAGCTTFEKGALTVNEKRPGKEKVAVSFVKGPALTALDWGAPLAAEGTKYTACLYDGIDALVAEWVIDRAGGECAGRACWRPVSDGYRYGGKNLSADGVKSILMKGGAVGKSKMKLKGANNLAKGQTSLPTGIAAALAGSSSATLEIHGDDLGPCYGVTFDDVKADTGLLFRANK